MAMHTGGNFVDTTMPLKDRLKLYDITKPPTEQPKNDSKSLSKQIPDSFINAMIVRVAVFVEEQNVPLENEFDEDDPRSFHFTIYASAPANKPASPEFPQQDESSKRRPSTKTPIGTIRLVPPPHGPHPNGGEETAWHKKDESYVKLGRLAVIKDFRGYGMADILITTALKLVKEDPHRVLPERTGIKVENARRNGTDTNFDGLVLVHAQKGVQKVWAKHGFVTDESMGTWMEEGIEHVGMWKKLDVKAPMNVLPFIQPPSMSGYKDA